MKRSAIDILEEIAAVGNWANRGSYWCIDCEQWVEVKKKHYGYGAYDVFCECCKTRVGDEDTWRYSSEDTAMERYEEIAKEFFNG